jgi:hypothetical protein
VEKLLLQPRDAIVDAGMKLREHAIKLFNEREIESMLLNLFESIIG